jgi:hypothetical protein
MMAEAQNNYTEEKISSEEFAAIKGLVAENTKGQAAFLRVLERLTYAQEQENPWMVYETGYEKLTGNSFEGYNTDLKNAAVLLVVIIASFSAFFATEFSTGMIHIVSCCKLGQSDTVKTKLRISFPLVTALFIIAYLPDFLSVYNQYSLPCTNAPLTSIPSLAGFPIDMALWKYLAVLYVYRYIVFLCILFVLFLL